MLLGASTRSYCEKCCHSELASEPSRRPTLGLSGWRAAGGRRRPPQDNHTPRDTVALLRPAQIPGSPDTYRTARYMYIQDLGCTFLK
ncbi:hypothetical protein J6590_004120 [Homalodisca vitripennis]|nr:hypothetical protein J6590_004120 [Homalodisca vitripennis]